MAKSRRCSSKIQRGGHKLALYHAAQGGYLEKVKELVEEGYIIVSPKKSIRESARKSIKKSAKMSPKGYPKSSVREKVDINMTNYEGHTPLYAAAQYGYLNIVEYLVRKGADKEKAEKDPNGPTDEAATPLYVACQNGNLDIVKYLVERGANMDVTHNYGMTPLHTAALHCKLDIVKYLVERGADIEKITRSKETPLMIALDKSCLTVVDYLIEKGVDIDVPQKYEKHREYLKRKKLKHFQKFINSIDKKDVLIDDVIFNIKSFTKGF